jgi:hypothetical protein
MDAAKRPGNLFNLVVIKRRDFIYPSQKLLLGLHLASVHALMMNSGLDCTHPSYLVG